MIRLIAVTILFLVICLSSTLSAQQLLDRIVAVVDNEIILLSELNLQVQLYLWEQRMPSPEVKVNLEELKREMLERMIDDKVLLAKAKEDSIEVGGSEVEKVLEAQLEELINRFGSEEALQVQLERQGLSLRDFKRRYRREIRDQLLKEKLMRAKMANITISRREVEEFYRTHRHRLPEQKEAVKLSHILVRVHPSQEAMLKALDKIHSIREQLRAGVDFAELARRYSEDPATAPNGGDLGWFSRGDFRLPELEEAAFRLQPGQVSEIIRTKLGYHLVKVEERRGDRVRVRHILIRVGPGTVDQERAHQKAEELWQRFQAGEDFATLAREYSEDQQTAPQGGELGWFLVEQIPFQFREPITHLKPGQVSPPVKSEFGYHLIRLDAKRERRKLTLERDWETIAELARQDKMRQEFEKWIKELRKEIYIDVRLSG